MLTFFFFSGCYYLNINGNFAESNKVTKTLALDAKVQHTNSSECVD